LSHDDRVRIKRKWTFGCFLSQRSFFLRDDEIVEDDVKLAIREGVNKAIHEAEKLTLLFIIPRLSQAREWTFIVGVGGGETGLMSLGPVSSAWLPDPRRRAHADIVETLRALGRAGLNRVARMDAGNACLYSCLWTSHPCPGKGAPA
jgi:hypothetical protein